MSRMKSWILTKRFVALRSAISALNCCLFLLLVGEDEDDTEETALPSCFSISSMVRNSFQMGTFHPFHASGSCSASAANWAMSPVSKRGIRVVGRNTLVRTREAGRAGNITYVDAWGEGIRGEPGVMEDRGGRKGRRASQHGLFDRGLPGREFRDEERDI
ncbi:hypothetical protein MN608_09248 [Microdochium nivale]|nr:hypothetical protein MN608_09248 [Microdochium nivale]